MDAGDSVQESDEAAHDVLAAEEFALPAPDPTIVHAPVDLPDDPSGIIEPHDVLAAEEFAFPASPPHTAVPARPPRRGSWRTVVLLGVGAAVAVGFRRRRRRGA